MNLFNFVDFKVQKVEELDYDYYVYVEVLNMLSVCNYCSFRCLIGYGCNEQVIWDFLIYGKCLVIYVDMWCWWCQDCGKMFMEILLVVNVKCEMIDRLVKWIGQQSLKCIFVSIVDDIGLDEKIIWNIFWDYVNELEVQFCFEILKWMGIDEIYFIWLCCVISNIGNNIIVNMLFNWDKKMVVNYFYQFEGKWEVQYVVMDMWMLYCDVVKIVLLDVCIVIDKFYVVWMVNDVLEKVCKSLWEQFIFKQCCGLMYDCFVFLKCE